RNWRFCSGVMARSSSRSCRRRSARSFIRLSPCRRRKTTESCDGSKTGDLAVHRVGLSHERAASTAGSLPRLHQGVYARLRRAKRAFTPVFDGLWERWRGGKHGTAFRICPLPNPPPQAGEGARRARGTVFAQKLAGKISCRLAIAPRLTPPSHPRTSPPCP